MKKTYFILLVTLLCAMSCEEYPLETGFSLYGYYKNDSYAVSNDGEHCALNYGYSSWDSKIKLQVYYKKSELLASSNSCSLKLYARTKGSVANDVVFSYVLDDKTTQVGKLADYKSDYKNDADCYYEVPFEVKDVAYNTEHKLNVVISTPYCTDSIPLVFNIYKLFDCEANVQVGYTTASISFGTDGGDDGIFPAHTLYWSDNGNQWSLLQSSAGGFSKFDITKEDLTPGHTYYLKLTVDNPDGSFDKTYKFTTFGSEPVDLGLSVLWDACDVGSDIPSRQGSRFAWGETSTKSSFSDTGYKYGNYGSRVYSKYTTSANYNLSGVPDNKTVLELSDDAAYVNKGLGYRMPTVDEWLELVNNTTHTLTYIDKVEGYEFRSIVPGYEDRFIFFPATQERDIYNRNRTYWCHGGYWTSSLKVSDHSDAYYYRCDYNLGNKISNSRYIGYFVRAVKTK